MCMDLLTADGKQLAVVLVCVHSAHVLSVLRMAAELQVCLKVTVVPYYVDNDIRFQHLCGSAPDQACHLEPRSEAGSIGSELGFVSILLAAVVLGFDDITCIRPYGIQEAMEGYKRAAHTHGWKVRCCVSTR